MRRERHEHKWTTIDVEYNKPALEVKMGWNTDNRLRRQLMNGWSLVKQQCECGDGRTYEVLGDWRPRRLREVEQIMGARRFHV